jgi:hypothetical protein
MSRYTHFTKLKHLIFLNGGSITKAQWQPMLDSTVKIVPAWQRGLIARLGSWEAGFGEISHGSQTRSPNSDV